MTREFLVPSKNRSQHDPIAGRTLAEESAMKINNIPADAPMFRRAPEETLTAIMQHMRSASYHYADGSANGWGQARQHVKDAAALIIQHRLYYSAITALVVEARPIFGVEEIINAILTYLYSKESA